MDAQSRNDRQSVNGGEPQPSWLAQNGMTLVVLAAFAAFFIYKDFDLTVIGLVAVGLGFVIFVHELGHFLAAKWCDVHVETFSIGFGPALPYCQFTRGETTYKLGLIPLGGYVKMLGEGAESEDGEDDPRSYKNKSVGQRMLIISAGVFMNMVLAVVGFVGIYMGPGRERIAGVIGQVDPGSPAWQAGLRSGSTLRRVASVEDPFFDQVKPRIALAGRGHAVPIAYTPPGSTSIIETAIEPRYEAESVGQKLIGISFGLTTSIRGAPRQKIPPYAPGSAAAAAQPKLEDGDRIIATTDPKNPTGPLLPLPKDPRNSDPERQDFFELYKRLTDLAGQPLTVEVVRSGESKPVSIAVPPAFARDLGMVMRMGPIFAVRNDSSAQRAGIKPRVEKGEPGVEIERIDVEKPEGGIIRFTTARSAQPTPGIEERPLDPVRLPHDLKQTASGGKTIRMVVLRPEDHKDRKKEEVVMKWDDSWDFAREIPSSSRSPISLAGLGIAYRAETVVDYVKKGSVAEQAGIKAGDVVKAVRFYRDADLKQSSKIDLKNDEWAFADFLLNDQMNPQRVDLFIHRAGENSTVEVSLAPPEDKTRPTIERGFSFDVDRRLQTADTPTQALALGGQQVIDTAINVYLSLQRMVEGGISFWKNANGPIAIAVTSYNVAGESFTQFVLLLSVLSVNLAVLNFLPIPVLDGGHMVFLLYEKFRGRPAPEVVRTAATFAGMALLLSLMACVVVLDIMKYFFKS